MARTRSGPIIPQPGRQRLIGMHPIVGDFGRTVCDPGAQEQFAQAYLPPVVPAQRGIARQGLQESGLAHGGPQQPQQPIQSGLQAERETVREFGHPIHARSLGRARRGSDKPPAIPRAGAGAWR